jgi:drug/metabolite transporter (DMT)-like permease
MVARMVSRSRSSGLGVAAVLGATVFWSFGGVLGKATEVSGVTLGFWRMWMATAILSVIVVVTRRLPTLRDLRGAAVLGVLFGLNICSFFEALRHLNVAPALVIGSLTPVVALPIAVVWMGERLTALKVVCALAAVVGVVVSVLATPSGENSGNSAIGYVWAVVSLVVWVAYLLVAKRVRGHVDTLPLMWVLSFVGALTVSLLALVLGTDLGQMQGADWWWVLLLALGPGILGHGMLTWAQPRVDASATSVLIQAEPVGAAIAAWVFLGERVSLVQGLSMLVVIAALVALAYNESRQVAVDDALM